MQPSYWRHASEREREKKERKKERGRKRERERERYLGHIVQLSLSIILFAHSCCVYRVDISYYEDDLDRHYVTKIKTATEVETINVTKYYDVLQRCESSLLSVMFTPMQ